MNNTGHDINRGQKDLWIDKAFDISLEEQSNEILVSNC